MKTMKTALALLLLGAACPLAASVDNPGANRYFVEAASLVREANDFGVPLSTDERLALLEDSLSRIEALLEKYPESDLAVTLVSGRSVGVISFDYLEKRIAQLRGEKCAISPAPACILEIAIGEIKAVTNSEDHTRLLHELWIAASRITGSGVYYCHGIGKSVGTDKSSAPGMFKSFRYARYDNSCISLDYFLRLQAVSQAFSSGATDADEWMELVKAGRIADAIAQARSTRNGIPAVLEVLQSTPALNAPAFQFSEAVNESMKVRDRVMRARMFMALATVRAQSRDSRQDSYIDGRKVEWLIDSSEVVPMFRLLDLDWG